MAEPEPEVMRLWDWSELGIRETAEEDPKARNH